VRRLAPLVLAVLASACLVQRAPPDAPAPTAARETRTSTYPDGTKRSEYNVLVWSDGRIERDGQELEYHPNGKLRSESSFSHSQPTGVWRTWFLDGTLRSEVDFGVPGSTAEAMQRFWHENGKLAAEGPALNGVRTGSWHYWNDDGTPLREGAYREGKRDGAWVFYDEHGAKRAEGTYELGLRIGTWTLWDEHGEAHTRSASEVELGSDQ